MFNKDLINKYSNVVTPEKLIKEFKKLTIKNKKHASLFNSDYVKYVVSDGFFNRIIFNEKIQFPSSKFMDYEYGNHNLHNIDFNFTGYVITCDKFTLYINKEDFAECIPLIEKITKTFGKRNRIFLFPEALAYFDDINKLDNFISNNNFSVSYSIQFKSKNVMFSNFSNVYFDIKEKKYLEV